MTSGCCDLRPRSSAARLILRSWESLASLVSLSTLICLTPIAVAQTRPVKEPNPPAQVTTQGSVPSLAQVRAAWRSSQATLLDRHGQVLHQLRMDPHERRLDWVPFEQMSAVLLSTVIESEDRRFYEHQGVDWAAVAGATLNNSLNQRHRGASTVTMQLAGLLDARLKRAQGGRTWGQKIEQAQLALRIERSWSKQQILEAYLNLAPFRGELVGIGAASQALFGKLPVGLDRRESALLVALLRSPNSDADSSARRACQLLRLHDCTAYEGFTRLSLARARDPAARPVAQAAPQMALHLARTLLREPGEQRRSSLDAQLQHRVIDAVSRHIAVLQGQHVQDAAVLVLDNPTGEVLAWVGSSGPYSSANQVDGVTALRQAGSTLKPFVYGLAIESRVLTAASLLTDSPLDLPTGNGLYVPQNYDRGFKGTVTVRTALGSSLNIPAVRALTLTGEERLLQLLRRAGLDSLNQAADHYGLSLALGGADVSLLQLTNAYRMLARDGQYSPVVTTPGQQTGARQVFSAATSFIVTDIMADRNARALTFGLDSALATRSWSAVKTGTSKDMRDNWCVGFTDRFTVGVWVGNADGQPMWNVSGASGAAPIWADVVHDLHRDRPSVPPAPPEGVVRQAVEYESKMAAARNEWFVGGTEIVRITAASSSLSPLTMVAPLPQTRYALDPDIPPADQTVLLLAHGFAADQAQWRVGGKPVGRGRRIDWSPRPGWHTIELWHGARLVERRDIEVRGARLVTPHKSVSHRPRAALSSG